jgi:hypothetical protein
MTNDRVIVIRKTAAVGVSDRPIEIVYSGPRFPSAEELARLSAIPGSVNVLDDAVAFTDPDAETTELPLVPMTELPERYEDRYPAMVLDPKMQRLLALARRRVLARSTMLAGYEESEAIAARVEGAKRALVNRGRLTIEELPLLFPGDQLFVRREVRGPVREWLAAFLIRVATFTRKDKRPTVFNHVATVIRPLREFEVSARAEFPDAALSKDMRRSGPVVDYLICEALGKGGVQLRPLLDSYGVVKDYSIAIARHRLATQEHRAKIVDAERSLLGRPYGYAKIGAHAADYALTQVWNLAITR